MNREFAAAAIEAVGRPETTGAAESAWLDASIPPDAPAVVLIGAGTGRGLEDVLARRRALKAVVLEPDPRAADVVRLALAGRGGGLDDRLAILAGPSYAGGPEVARRFRELNRAPVLVHPTLDRLHPREVARARNFVAKLAFETDANESARRATAGRYLLQTLANTPRLAGESDISVLTSLLSGLPAVVVGAGPSLDENIHDLAPVRDRVIVIACDTAARPLIAAGIEPHFIVATDSSRANAAHLSSIQPTDSWLVAEGSLHPSAFTHFTRRTFYFRVGDHEPWPWLNSLGLVASRLDTWGSVLTSAFAFAEHLGCNPVALVGADLAFTGGRPYCRGTTFESLWASWSGGGTPLDETWRMLVDQWPVVTMPDVHGQPARTAPHLVAFRDWLLERAASHRDTRVINATDAGVLTGAGIVHAALCPTFAPAEVVDRALLTRVLRSAHQAGTGDLARVLGGITALLAGSREELFAQWMQFSAGTVGYPAIEAALRSPEHTAWTLAHQPSNSEDDL